MTDSDKKKYWYLITHAECPDCGREDVYRERKYSPKPRSVEDRHKQRILSCPCIY